MKKNKNQIEKLQKIYNYTKKFIRTDIDESTFENLLLEEIYIRRLDTMEKIKSFLIDVNFVFQSIGYTERRSFLNLDLIRKISIQTKLSFISFKSFIDPISGISFEKEITEEVFTEYKKQFQSYLSSRIEEDIKKMSFDSLIRSAFEILNGEGNSSTVPLFTWVKSILVDDKNLGLKELNLDFYDLVFNENKLMILNQTFSKIEKELCLKNVCIDQERSKIVLNWFKKNRDPLLSTGFPFLEGEKFLVVRDFSLDAKELYFYEIKNVDFKDKIIKTKYTDGDIRHYGVVEKTQTRSGNYLSDKKTIFDINNVSRMLIFK